MALYENVFLGVTISDMKSARAMCERLLGVPMKGGNSSFYDGDHWDASIDGSLFELRLNHFNDGLGYRWCIENAKYPLVLDCGFRSPEMKQRILGRLAQFPMIELPPEGK